MPWDNSRPNHVPTRIREACLARDGYQCVHPLQDGKRCPETRVTELQAAHLKQWRAGERTTVDMLRTLCTWHHNRETQAEAAAAARRKPRPSARHPREQHPGLRT